MKKHEELVRWTEPASGLPESLHVAVKTAAEEEPSPESLRAVAGGVLARLDAPAAESPEAAGAAGPGGGGGAGGLSLKGVLAALGGVGLVGAAILLLGRTGEAPVPVDPPASHPIAPEPPRSPEAPAPAPAPAAAEPASAPSDQNVTPPARRRGALPPRPAAESPPVPTELALLERARKLVRSAPGAALDLTREHEARFPAGLLEQEREVVAIDALLGLGRRPDAEARARRFHARHPASIHRSAVDRLLSASRER